MCEAIGAIAQGSPGSARYGKNLDSRAHGKGHFQRLEWLEKEKAFLGSMYSVAPTMSIYERCLQDRSTS